jgi:hypothetical protein
MPLPILALVDFSRPPTLAADDQPRYRARSRTLADDPTKPSRQRPATSRRRATGPASRWHPAATAVMANPGFIPPTR